MTPNASHHPKLACVLNDAVNAAERNEKTLIFCTRVATLEQLQREIDRSWEARLIQRWQHVYPDAGPNEIFDTRPNDKVRQGRHSLLQSRFHQSRDALYLVPARTLPKNAGSTSPGSS